MLAFDEEKKGSRTSIFRWKKGQFSSSSSQKKKQKFVWQPTPCATQSKREPRWDTEFRNIKIIRQRGALGSATNSTLLVSLDVSLFSMRKWSDYYTSIVLINIVTYTICLLEILKEEHLLPPFCNNHTRVSQNLLIGRKISIGKFCIRPRSMKRRLGI